MMELYNLVNDYDLEQVNQPLITYPYDKKSCNFTYSSFKNQLRQF